MFICQLLKKIVFEISIGLTEKIFASSENFTISWNQKIFVLSIAYHVGHFLNVLIN